jgi:D-amino-acid oxidase
VAAGVVARTLDLVPEIAHARVLRHKVGLRPARPAVRLERVADVIHCYGHGGAGVTLSWGCADEVAALAGV